MRNVVLSALIAVSGSLMSAGEARGKTIYWVESTFGSAALRKADTNGSNVQTVALAPASLPQGIDLDLGGNRLWWTELAFAGANVERASLDLSGATPVVTGGSSLRGIALDSEHGKVYWTASNLALGPRIQRANLDGSNAEVLIQFAPGGPSNPRDIVLDVAGGKMYWADFDEGKIKRASPSVGALPEDVLAGLSGPVGLALDPVGQMIYWTEANANLIRRAHLDGTGISTLVSGLATPNDIALDPSEGKMYWTEIGAPRIRRADLDGSDPQDLAIAVSFPTAIVVPFVGCPQAVSASNSPGQCSALVSFRTTATGNPAVECRIGGTPVSSPHLFPVGTTTVSCGVPGSSEPASCSFDVIVSDSEPPVVTAPPAVSVGTGPGASNCTALVADATLGAGSAGDNCSGVSLARAGVPAGNRFPVGSTTVTYTATDGAGRTAAATQTVTVADDTPPALSCPADLVVIEDPPGSGSAIVTFPNPPATDNCAIGTETCSPPSGSTFPLGTTAVSCAATDAAGNSARCGFNVTVERACTLGCPADIVVANDPGRCGAVVSFVVTPHGAGCGPVAYSTPPGSFFPVGTTSVDASAGAGARCSFSVTVTDAESPTVSCPQGVVVAAGPDCRAALPNLLPAAAAFDNCTPAGSLTLSQSPPAGTLVAVGFQIVTIDAVDAAGNRGSCATTVQVTDDSPPMLSDVTVDRPTLWPPNHQLRDIAVSYTATDACGAVDCSLSVASNEPVNGAGDGDTAPDWAILDANHVQLRAERAGKSRGRTYTVTVTCRDASGNRASKSATVDVVSSQSAAREGGAGEPVGWLAPSAFSLGRNIPNPFDLTTTVHYALPRTARVSLRIYGVRGELERVLVEGMEGAGHHAVELDARALPVGVHFCRLDASDPEDPSRVFREIRKMVRLD